VTAVTAIGVSGAMLAAAALVASADALAHVPPVAASNEGIELLRVQARIPEPGDPRRPQGPINTIQDVFAALRKCWIPPPREQSRPGMQITVLLSFTRSGALLGKPTITYQTHEASEDERLAYRVAVAETLRRCTPLPFTDALGNALAGRPLTMRFIDNRNLKQAGYRHD
jgi:hypothetical protein